MPHAEDSHTMTQQPMTNGDVPSSHFLSHLASIPVVNDGINTFKTNPYGAKSIDLAETTYSRVGKPLAPYLRTPYSYAAPYVAKADSLADKSLGSVETRFPIIKQDTTTLRDSILNVALFPFHLAGQGRDYVFSTYNDEYSKTVNRNNRGPGISSTIMAIISTEMKITSDALQIVADYLGPKAEEAKQNGAALAQQARHKKDEYAAKVQEKRN